MTEIDQVPSDRVFSPSMPEVYDTYLVPLIFEPYAADLVARLATRPLTVVLETAAGSGAVTRALAAALAGHVSLVATDLSAPMLERATAVGTARPVEWRQADAMALPFPDASFDAVVCQFGAMFFPDNPRAFPSRGRHGPACARSRCRRRAPARRRSSERSGRRTRVRGSRGRSPRRPDTGGGPRTN